MQDESQSVGKKDLQGLPGRPQKRAALCNL